MLFFDIILIVVVCGFAYYGLFFGFIRTLGLFAGLLLGILIGSSFYLPVFNYVHKIFFGYDALGRIFIFLLIFGIIFILVRYLFKIVENVFEKIAIIPFLRTINRILGLFFGFLAGCLVVGILIVLASKLPVTAGWFGGWLADSKLAYFFIKVNNIILPVITENIKNINSIM